MIYYKQNVNSNGKINDLEQKILSAINQQCQCNVDHDQITASRFVCLSESPNSANVFSTINGTSQVPTSELLGYLESWVSSGFMVMIQTQPLYLNNCTTAITTTSTELPPVIVDENTSTIVAVSIAVSLSVVLTGFVLCIIATGLSIKYLMKWKKNLALASISPLPPLEVSSLPNVPHQLPPLEIAPLPPPLEMTPLEANQPLPPLEEVQAVAPLEVTPLAQPLLPPKAALPEVALLEAEMTSSKVTPPVAPLEVAQPLPPPELAPTPTSARSGSTLFSTGSV